MNKMLDTATTCGVGGLGGGVGYNYGELWLIYLSIFAVVIKLLMDVYTFYQSQKERNKKG